MRFPKLDADIGLCAIAVLVTVIAFAHHKFKELDVEPNPARFSAGQSVFVAMTGQEAMVVSGRCCFDTIDSGWRYTVRLAGPPVSTVRDMRDFEIRGDVTESLKKDK